MMMVMTRSIYAVPDLWRLITRNPKWGLKVLMTLISPPVSPKWRRRAKDPFESYVIADPRSKVK